jgi:hypothetical protein
MKCVFRLPEFLKFGAKLRPNFSVSRLDDCGAKQVVSGAPCVADGLVYGGQRRVGLSAVRLQLNHTKAQLLAVVEVAHRELQVGLTHDSLRFCVEVTLGLAADSALFLSVSRVIDAKRSWTSAVIINMDAL